MKYISCCLFQSLFNGLICVQTLNAVQKLMEKLMQKQVGDWQNVNSHLPTNAPECIYEGTLPEQ